MRQQSALEIWMRTGWWPDEGLDLIEQKFNPWHDPENGRFTFAGQGRYFARGAQSQRTPASRVAAPTPIPTPTASRRTTPQRGPITRGLEAVRREVVREDFKKHLIKFEGNRNDIYLDSRGFPTVGIGHKLPNSYRSRVGELITDAQKEAFWRADSETALKAAQEQMRLARISDPNFLVPLAAVNFQLGGGWYKEHKDTWDLIRTRQYGAAAREVQNSDWYHQTPKRVRAIRDALLRLERAEQARRAKLRSGSASR